MDGEPQGQVRLASDGVCEPAHGRVCETSDPFYAGRETISVEDPWLTPDG